MNKPIIIQELEEVLKHLKSDTSRVERLIDVFKTSIIHDRSNFHQHSVKVDLEEAEEEIKGEEK